jgi:hypothetical protein
MKYASLQVMVLMFVFTRCGFTPPLERFDACFNALLENDLVMVHTYFVFMDRATMSADELRETYMFSQTEMALICSSDVGYHIYNSRQDRDTMRAHVSIQAPVVMGEIIKLILFSIDTVMESTESLEAGTVQSGLLSYHGMLVMVKEGNEWLISGNWEEQRRVDAELAQKRLDYMEKHLSTGDLRVYSTDDGQACLSLVIHNKGGQSLSDIELYVVGYTAAGEPCFTHTAHPIIDRALAPRTQRRCSMDISQAPANWSGRIEARILNCVFSTVE